MNKKAWKLLFCLSLIIVLILTGCGQQAASDNGQAAPAQTQAAAPAQTEAAAPAQTQAAAPAQTEAAAPAQTQAADTGSDEDMSDITVMYMHLGQITDWTDVEAAANALTEAKINTHVTLQPVEFGNYVQQINLAISSNEKLDVLMTCPLPGGNFMNLTSQKQLLALDDLMPEYGRGITELLPEVCLKAGQIDGVQYAIPCYSDKVEIFYWIVRKDMAEKYNIDTDNVKSVDDVEAALDIFAKAEPSMSALVPTVQSNMLTKSTMYPVGATFEDTVPFDPIIDQLLVIKFTQDPTKIVNYFATDEFREVCERMHKWYEAGYVYKDASTNMEDGTELVKSGKGISYFASTTGEFGTIDSNCGHEMIYVPIYKITTSTSSYTGWTYSIPVTSTDTAASMKFIDMLFTDADLSNLLLWGLEGVHWEHKPDGTIGFPEGVTAENSGYYNNASWMFGNVFDKMVWEGQDPNMRQEQLEKQKTGLFSPAIGFTADTSDFATEYSAVTNVISEYKNGLISGVLDPATELPAFLEKLDNSGMQVIVDNCQAQYDAWMAATGK